MRRKLLLLILSLSSSQLLADNSQYILFEGFYGIESNGHVQVRESEVIGTKFDLVEDLGLDNVTGLGLSYGFRVGVTWVDIGYSHYLLDGKKNLSETATFNGATYARGEVNVNKSIYRRYHLLFKHEVKNHQGDLSHLSLGGGLICETLKFYLDGEFDDSSTRFEKFESFDRQMVPVPAIYGDASIAINRSFALGTEILLAWLPKTETWYREGGNIYFEQNNIDAKLKLTWRLNTLSISSGYKYKSFFQKQESHEDTNEFQLTTIGPFIDVGLLF
jgi:hypothetical protein